jgi:hypothetical protein
MASVIYNSFKQRLMTGEVDMDNDQIWCALFPTAYSPNDDTQNVYADISASECAAGNGYVAGGTILTGVTVMLNLSTNKGILDANDVTWANSTITARFAVLYKKNASNNSWLVAAFDFGADKASSNGDFTVQWNASGIIDLY